MGKRASYAVMAVVLMGCSASVAPGGGGGGDAASDDVQTGVDAVTQDLPKGQDVADASRPDGVAPTDVLAPTDVVAPIDVVMKSDGGGDAAVDAPLDASADDVVRADAGPRDVSSDAESFMCPMGITEIVLPGMVAPIMGTTAGMGSLASTGCQSNARGPESFYTLRVTERTGVLLSTEGMATSFDTILTIRRCDTGAEVACDDDGGDNPGLSSVVRAQLDPGVYSVIVDGYNGGMGGFVLNASTYALAPNSVCGAATALAPGATLAMQNLLGAGAPNPVCARTFDGAPLYYSLTVPPSTAVTVTATPVMGESWTASIRALESCTATSCVALGTAGSVAVGNTTSAPRTVTLAVARTSSAAGGSFSLTASTPVPLAMNASCASAATLAPGASLTGQDLAGAALASTLCARTTDSAALYYSVTVPASSRVDLSATPTAPMTPVWTPSIRVLDACDAMTCVSSAASATPTSLVNTGSTPRSYRVIVARAGSASPGVFTLTASAAQTLAPNAVCAGATLLTSAGLSNQDLSRAALRSAACLTTATGGQLYYALTVPPNTAATVVARPTGTTPMWTPVIRLLDACDATACAQSASGTAGMPASLLFVNGSSTERSFKLSVAATAVVEGTFNLEYSAQTVAPSTVCERPIALSPNGMDVMGDTATGIRRAARCNTTDMGTEVFYSLEIPAGTRVALTATPASGATWRPRLRVITDCSATSCSQNNAPTMDGAAAALNIDNAALLPTSVIVSVSSVNTADGGAFALRATPSPLMGASSYTLSSLSASCDDVSMGAAMLPASGAWSDDSATSISALPFTARFFGADATHYSVTSNGYAQLWPSMTGTPSTAYSNVALGSTVAPNNMVAPFWDDLVPVDPMTTSVRTAVMGAAPGRRFVIAWSGWRHIAGDTADRLNFQAKLFETTGVIEFHYCSIAPANAMNSGASTTIGLEDAMGTATAMISFNTAGRAATGTAYRLTPR